jgi:rhodanese-related sulfurtransferase
MAALLDSLARLKLLKDAEAARERVPPEEPPHVSLLRLCDAGLLEGGLTVALGVRPEELVGPLTLAMGGAARRFKLVDVRERPALELHILAGEVSERWEVEDLQALVHNLNDLYRMDPGVRAVAVLGEWQDALQLLCTDKRALPRLLRERFFDPLNREALSRMLERDGDSR